MDWTTEAARYRTIATTTTGRARIEAEKAAAYCETQAKTPTS